MALPTVGILGGGQLGRMLLESANRLNIKVNVLDQEQAPAKLISNHSGHVTGSFADREAVQKLAASCDVLTVEIEHIDTQSLEEVSKDIVVEPHWQTLRTIQNKFKQKEQLTKARVPVADYREIREGSAQELKEVGDAFGYPFMLKAQTQAYDGQGNYPVRSPNDIEPALKALSGRPLYAEKWANFRLELAAMIVKTKDSVLSFPVVETVHEDSICKLVYAPARNVPEHVVRKAQAFAKEAIATFEGKGVFGVEMFLLPDDSILVNEIAPRPHNSGHYTIEACPLSQYDAHLRAILDLPVSPKALRLREPAIMLNILGGATRDSHLQVAQRAVSVPDASVHLYAKGDARPGRKMGHITLTAPTMAEAENEMQPLVEFVDHIRVQRTDITISRPSGAPSSSSPSRLTPATVAVIMGSDSDLPTLMPGLAILKRFNIPHDVRITSAHRTPRWMAEYVSSAASRDTRVIIAAAGGAAHLPGMAAAYTTLPVIGVPVKGSVLDGVDASLSIQMMPRGVPVATVGTQNSVNAALLAARIVALHDPTVKKKYEEFVDEAESEVVRKDGRLKEMGAEEYQSTYLAKR